MLKVKTAGRCERRVVGSGNASEGVACRMHGRLGYSLWLLSVFVGVDRLGPDGGDGGLRRGEDGCARRWCVANAARMV